MSTLGQQLRDDAYKLIQELGRSVVFYESTSTFTPASGAVTESSAKSWTVKSTPPGSEGLRFLGFEVAKFDYNSMLLEGSTYFYVAAKNLPFTPAKGMKFVADSKTYFVDLIDVVWAGEEKALYGISGKST